MSAMKHYVSRPARQLKKGQRICRAVRDVVVLAMIEWEPLYGAELCAEYERTTGELCQTLYPTLGRLREKGWIVSVHSTTSAGNWCIRHKLTPEGRSVLGQFRKFIVGV